VTDGDDGRETVSVWEQADSDTAATTTTSVTRRVPSRRENQRTSLGPLIRPTLDAFTRASNPRANNPRASAV